MLLLIALASTPTPPPHVKAVAKATVRIERPVTVSRETWDRLPKSRRSEKIVRDEQGRRLLLRLVENP
ncbi:MAG TPA: hypothetical protein VFI88_01185 [Sphingomicrobium sp.]|jgi:hypothetical protein|nr:hypothetical protein [Sphingomicrobium sp.]